MMNLDLNILLVDDSKDIREIIASLLTLSGYNVSTASNGAEGLETFKQQTFDLIITDIIMPIKDGNQFIAELYSKFKNLPPIIALSSQLSNILPSPAITLEATKPITTSDLRQAVLKAMGTSKEIVLGK